MEQRTYTVYKFNELHEDSKRKAINELIQFEIENMNEQHPLYTYALEMERMKTPWFLAEVLLEKEKDWFIETLEANDYDFLKDGTIV